MTHNNWLQKCQEGAKIHLYAELLIKTPLEKPQALLRLWCFKLYIQINYHKNIFNFGVNFMNLKDGNNLDSKLTVTQSLACNKKIHFNDVLFLMHGLLCKFATFCSKKTIVQIIWSKFQSNSSLKYCTCIWQLMNNLIISSRDITCIKWCKILPGIF